MRSLQALCEDKGLGESWEGLLGEGLVESDVESSVALGAREGLLPQAALGLVVFKLHQKNKMV